MTEIVAERGPEAVLPLEEPTHAGIAVQAVDTGRILMLQRSWDETDAPEVRGTWEFPGGGLDDGEEPEAGAWREFHEETGLPTPDGETVMGWRSPDGVYQGFLYRVPVERDAFDEINPDHEAAELANPDDPERRNPDVTAWFTVEQAQALGPALRPEVAAMDWSIFDLQEDDMTATTTEAPVEEAQTLQPWFGVLAPEGIPSGDGRMFADNSLRMRDLPVPLTWQKVGSPGHDGRVTVGRIDRIWRDQGLVFGEGVFLSTPEAAEAIELVKAFGRYGVSIDADDVTEVYEEGNTVVFADARVSSACMVDIPAFMQAFVALGTWAEVEAAGGWGAPSEPIGEPESGDAVGDEDECENRDEDGNCLDDKSEEEIFAVSAAKTEDGPGWLTHPVDTDRLRDYWTKGAGAAKIAWGTPGDFNRCRTNLAKYVKPQHLDGYCANRHYDALGIWPGEHSGETVEAAPALSLVAAAPLADLPGEWFEDPGLTEPTALTITEDGRVFGHLATWGLCHIGARGECVEAPHSASNYAYFRTGLVHTTTGPVAVGNITMGGGHAGPNLRWRAAMEHYDSTSAVVADVAVGEDEFGVWVAGAMRNGVTREQIAELQASGGLSGDWREVVRGSDEMELVAALAVNVGGFPVPRTAATLHNGKPVSLVAAGAVLEDKDPVEEVADAVVAILETRAEVQARATALRQSLIADRLASLRAKIN